MKVGIIGASGFLGRQAVSELRKLDEISICIWRQNENGSFLSKSSRLGFLRKNKLDAVVNLGWCDTSVDNYRFDPRNFSWLEATISFFEECVDAGIYCLSAGSADDVGKKLDPYSVAKTELRKIFGREFSTIHGLLRPQVVFSESQMRPRLLRDSLSHVDSVPARDPHSITDFVDVRDVGEFFSNCTQKLATGVIYGGSGLLLSNQDFVNIIRSRYFNTKVDTQAVISCSAEQPVSEAKFTRVVLLSNHYSRNEKFQAL